MKEIFTRRSVRSYTAEPITDDAILTLLKAAMAAPSAGNQQPWEFIVVRDRAVLTEITKVHPYSQMLLEAPAAIVVCADLNRSKYPVDYWVQDCAAATQNILLAATAEGIGSCWLAVYPDAGRVAGVRRIFAVPEQFMPFSIVSLGYPAKPPRLVDRFEPQRIHQGTW